MGIGMFGEAKLKPHPCSELSTKSEAIVSSLLIAVLIAMLIVVLVVVLIVLVVMRMLILTANANVNACFILTASNQTPCALQRLQYRWEGAYQLTHALHTTTGASAI